MSVLTSINSDSNIAESLIMKSKPIILCVDDEKIILECLKGQIRNFFKDDCIIELAQSGGEGLEIIADLMDSSDSRPSVIISDQMMPGMRGHEFLAKVHASYPHITKILLTGMTHSSDIDLAYQNGKIDIILEKPWSMSDLHEAIHNSLSSVLANQYTNENAPPNDR